MNLVTTITALGDNYIYLYQYDDTAAFVIDPGDSKPVFHVLETRNLTLSAVLVTHNHFDHCGGARDLKKKTGCEIIGPDRNGIPGIDRLIKDAEIIELNGTGLSPKTPSSARERAVSRLARTAKQAILNISSMQPEAVQTGNKPLEARLSFQTQPRIQVIATPGHTATSICYYIHPTKDNPGILFTGDTLFTGGCGRIFESNAETMWNSLKKIAALPNDTLVYPGHNYTQENYQFALTIDPQNQPIKKRLEQANFAPPSTIAQEKQTNIFLQANTPQIKKALEIPTASNPETFAKLRRKKDTFA